MAVIGDKMLLTIILVLLVLSILFGGVGHTHWNFGLAGWSPAGIVLLVLIVLYLTGHLGSCSHLHF
jgi:Flp pilus assembly protein protease CpaA